MGIVNRVIKMLESLSGLESPSYIQLFFRRHVSRPLLPTGYYGIKVLQINVEIVMIDPFVVGQHDDCGEWRSNAVICGLFDDAANKAIKP
jgi:hypothetical protein